MEVNIGQKEVNIGKYTHGYIFCIHTHMIAMSIIEYITLTSEVIKGHWRSIYNLYKFFSDLTHKSGDISPKTFGLEVGETIPLLLGFQMK